MREWNAERYHEISNPMFAMAMPVLERLSLRGNETVLDVGCGSGLVTEQLLKRLLRRVIENPEPGRHPIPEGRVVAIDMSANMLATARAHLSGYDGRVQFVQANAAALPLVEAADAIFSTATFHWVLDHPALFASLYRALKPGGRLVAQCGGGPNIQRVHDRAAALMRSPAFAPYFERWREPWEFADAATTRQRLKAAGFIDVRTSIEPAPVVQPDAVAFATYLTNIVCRPHLAYLPTEALRQQFVSELTTLAARDPVPFELDYWRLNIDASRP